MQATWVSKGDVRKVCLKETSKHEQRQRQQKKRQKKPKIIIFSKMGLMDKNQRKNGILKGRTKGKQGNKTEWEETQDFKDRFLGDTKKERKLWNCRKTAFLGLFPNKKQQKTQRYKTKPPKNKNDKQKEHLVACWQTPPPISGNFCFFNLHSCISAKLCFADDTIKIVFSAEHSFCVSQIVKPPFEAPYQNGTSETKSAILGFPCACWNPYFCSVLWLCMVTKKEPFSETASCNENSRFFFTFRTQIVFFY